MRGCGRSRLQLYLVLVLLLQLPLLVPLQLRNWSLCLGRENVVYLGEGIGLSELIDETEACMRACRLSASDQAYFLFDHLEGKAREEIKQFYCRTGGTSWNHHHFTRSLWVF